MGDGDVELSPQAIANVASVRAIAKRADHIATSFEKRDGLERSISSVPSPHLLEPEGLPEYSR